ncbi:nucleotidyltransferase family protein [Sphingomonas cannabina]|uniref:nucleotidyltransferase family protein n=1 Tax=Sphingomonas cannabina TaxID=2899123 RepID=UPI001F3BC645|nr:nucleotidyltransferase family protein [Sphingomonas cannabina]UIJ47441.1 nucleotidyltransferase family protein [Sphingomonas cannabina]
MTPLNASAEFRFVCACCRAPADPGRESAITNASRAVTDWSRVVAIARRHRVIGLTADGVRRCGGAPDEIAGELKELARSMAANGLRQIAETIRLDQALRAAGARPLFLKGMPLGALAYGNPLLKHSIDIDVVVEPDALPAAAAALDDAGYIRNTPAPDLPPAALAAWFRHAKEASWRHPVHGTCIELHGRILHNPLLVPALTARSPRQTVALQSGAEVETLAVPELYAHLVAHGAMHGWTRLKWLADLAGMVRSASVSVAELHAMADAMGAGRCSAQALLLGEALLGLELPDALANRLRADRAIRRLVRIALGCMTGRNETEESRNPTGIPLAVTASQFLLRPSWRYKWAQLRAQSANPTDRARLADRPWLAALAPAIGGVRWTVRNLGLLPRAVPLAQSARER